MVQGHCPKGLLAFGGWWADLRASFRGDSSFCDLDLLSPLFTSGTFLPTGCPLGSTLILNPRTLVQSGLPSCPSIIEAGNRAVPGTGPGHSNCLGELL